MSWRSLSMGKRPACADYAGSDLVRTLTVALFYLSHNIGYWFPLNDGISRAFINRLAFLGFWYYFPCSHICNYRSSFVVRPGWGASTPAGLSVVGCFSPSSFRAFTPPGGGQGSTLYALRPRCIFSRFSSAEPVDKTPIKKKIPRSLKSVAGFFISINW